MVHDSKTFCDHIQYSCFLSRPNSRFPVTLRSSSRSSHVIPTFRLLTLDDPRLHPTKKWEIQFTVTSSDKTPTHLDPWQYYQRSLLASMESCDWDIVRVCPGNGRHDCRNIFSNLKNHFHVQDDSPYWLDSLCADLSTNYHCRNTLDSRNIDRITLNPDPIPK